MNLNVSTVEKLRAVGMWIDYYAGYARCAGLQFKSNNWRKLHGIPMERRKRK